MQQRIILLYLFALCLSLPSMAQRRHEISVAGGYGLSSLQYKSNVTDNKKGYNAHASLGYNFYFTPNWSVKTGAGLGFYSAVASLVQPTTYPKSRVDDWDFTYTYSDYREIVPTTLFTIPVMVQGETGGKAAFYAAAGAKIGIPLHAQYKTSGRLTTSGYHTVYKITVDNLPAYGFGQYDVDETTDLDLNLSVQLSIETGVKWRLTDQFSLYAGGYLDYGLTNLHKKAGNEGVRLITYQPSGKPNEYKFLYGGFLHGSDKLYPVSAGITLRLGFGLGGL